MECSCLTAHQHNIGHSVPYQIPSLRQSSISLIQVESKQCNHADKSYPDSIGFVSVIALFWFYLDQTDTRLYERCHIGCTVVTRRNVYSDLATEVRYSNAATMRRTRRVDDACIKLHRDTPMNTWLARTIRDATTTINTSYFAGRWPNESRVFIVRKTKGNVQRHYFALADSSGCYDRLSSAVLVAASDSLLHPRLIIDLHNSCKYFLSFPSSDTVSGQFLFSLQPDVYFNVSGLQQTFCMCF